MTASLVLTSIQSLAQDDALCAEVKIEILQELTIELARGCIRDTGKCGLSFLYPKGGL